MKDKETKRTVLIIITLDTKGEEARFLKERILEDGLDVLVLDSGILGEPRGGVVPDIPASETARAAGTTLEELRKKGSRGAAVEEMLKGVAALTAKLHREGRIQGAISLGGAEGGVMAASAMQVLPPGFPKTTVWGYGSIQHPGTVAEGGSFNTSTRNWVISFTLLPNFL